MRAGWVVDLRLHSLSCLPRADSTVLLRVGSRPCVTTSYLDGMAFLGAWVRLAVQQATYSVKFQVLCGSGSHASLAIQRKALDAYSGGFLPDKIPIPAASGTLELRLEEGAGPGQSSDWHDIEIPLNWHSRHSKAGQHGGASEGSTSREEQEEARSAQPLLRLSYRVTQSSFARPGPATGVPECSNEPVELLTTPLDRVSHCYAHGGFMGLACSLMTDGSWRSILEREDPASFRKAHKLCTKLLQKDPRPNKRLGALMTCLENSPVLCAYGLVRSGCTTPVSSTRDPGGSDATPGLAAGGEAAVSTTEASSAASGTSPGSQAFAETAIPQLQQLDIGNSQSDEVLPQLPSVFRTRSKRLEDYLASLTTPNSYGYRPLALEWDLWIHPTRPSLLHHATVDHGTAGQLVTQAITANVPGLSLLAKKAGVAQIKERGVSPVFWLNALGHSINQAVNGDRDTPLPLYRSAEQLYRLTLTVLRAYGGALAEQQLWDGVYVRALIDSGSVAVPKDRTRATQVDPGEGCLWNQDLFFWPLPLGLEKTDVLVEVRGDPKGVRRDKALGMVRVPLQQLLRQHPKLLDGQKHVEIEFPIGPKQQRRIHQETKRNRVLPGDAASTSPGAVPTADSGGEEESDDGEPEVARRSLSTTDALTAGLGVEERGIIRLRFKFEALGVLEASQSFGVTPAAAQTCLAMLSKPGGLFLDIKSAYSTPEDIQQLVSTLTGIGVHCKAVCSFLKRQLDIGGLTDTVLFFHGISGLENSCDDGVVERGQFVLFNGASFLADLKPEALKGFPAKRVREALTRTMDYPVDPIVLRRYIGLCETYCFAGGIYVQEPDASPAGVSALAKLVTDYPEYFPLGFAYGHLSGLGVNFLDQGGRGFASQQIIEELQARKELSRKVMERIKNGEHRGATLATIIAWGHRIVYGTGGMDRTEQRTLVVLLSQVWPHRNVAKVVSEIGGIPTIFLRSFEHYSTGLSKQNPLVDIMRLLRDRGVIAGKTSEEKLELAKFFCGPQLRGGSLMTVLKSVGVQKGLHRLAREGLLCVLESCSRDEYQQVLCALGGRGKVEEGLRGRGLGRSALARLAAIEQVHSEYPARPSYLLRMSGGTQSVTQEE